ncbi:GNAT family N-acetyltransferase [Vibrio makurazakiensis]|uniref:GNAT family N-acetyltransferase n=1 Tax=Vibrio makurazakiensis TaxID=2910250 RepID=UPI003D0AEC7E
MHIRTGTVHDIQSILRLANQINIQHHLGAPSVFSNPQDIQSYDSEDENENYWLSLMLEPNGTFIVAEIEMQVVGFVVARITQNKEVSFIRDNKVCRVNTIVVDDSVQASGVGRALMAKITQWAQAREATEMKLEVMEFNEGARGFYEALGMKTQSRIMSMPLE